MRLLSRRDFLRGTGAAVAVAYCSPSAIWPYGDAGHGLDYSALFGCPTTVDLIGSTLYVSDMAPPGHAPLPDLSFGTINRMDLAGGPVELLESGRIQPRLLTHTDGFLIWAEQGYGATTTQIYRRAIATSGVDLITSVDSDVVSLSATNDFVLIQTATPEVLVASSGGTKATLSTSVLGTCGLKSISPTAVSWAERVGSQMVVRVFDGSLTSRATINATDVGALDADGTWTFTDDGAGHVIWTPFGGSATMVPGLKVLTALTTNSKFAVSFDGTSIVGYNRETGAFGPIGQGGHRVNSSSLANGLAWIEPSDAGFGHDGPPVVYAIPDVGT